MRRWWCSAALIAGVAAAAPAMAQDADVGRKIADLESLIAEQQKQLSAQRQAIDEQEIRLKAQQRALDALRGEALSTLRATGGEAEPTIQVAQEARPANPPPPPNPEAPKVAVGEPPPDAPRVEVAALPEAVSVLTPPGKFVLEPSFRYVHSSSNRLVFRGVEIVTGIQIGVIEASDADRNTIAPAIALRYGLAKRLEAEITVPWLDRADRVTTVEQRDAAVTQTLSLKGDGVGDIEAGLRWQINAPRPGRPVYIAQLRYKHDNATGPYDVDFDEFGVAKTLAVGSGFKAMQAGLSFLYPSDPAVIFGGVTYLYNFPKDIDRNIGGTEVGRVEPGYAFSFNAGFGFAINPVFSFSLGYEHTHVGRTTSVLGGTHQKSEPAEIGEFAFSWSLRLSERLSLQNSYEIGVTSDAPDVAVIVRLPYRF